ncbi:hypothetical protein AZA_88059 [Nitrospirillum viridazoti Y2]|nr:hypothetical protein AZA_88059 [Nitrospirillum amazonense Y2]
MDQAAVAEASDAAPVDHGERAVDHATVAERADAGAGGVGEGRRRRDTAAIVGQQADGTQVGDSGATAGAGQRGAVGEAAQAAAGRDIQGVPGADVGAVAQRGQAAADIVVGDGHQQVGADDGAARIPHAHSTLAGYGDAAVVGRAARAEHGGTAAHHVIAQGRQAGHHGAADGGVAADRQFPTRQHQGAGRLAEVARHRDRVGQCQRRACVQHRMPGGIDAVVQNQVTAGEHKIAAGIVDHANTVEGHNRVDRAAAHRALQRAHRGAAAADNGEGGIGFVHDVAGNGPAVDHGPDAGLDGETTVDQAGVDQGTDTAAGNGGAGGDDGTAVAQDVYDAARVADGGVVCADCASVGQQRDEAGVEQSLAGTVGDDQPAVADRADGGAALIHETGLGPAAEAAALGVDDRADAAPVVDALDETGIGQRADRALIVESGGAGPTVHGSAVAQGTDGAGDIDAVDRTADRAVVGQRADRAAASHQDGGVGVDARSIVDGALDVTDIVVAGDQHQVAAQGTGHHLHAVDDVAVDDGRDAGVAGTGATGHQGVAHSGTDQIGGGRGQATDIDRHRAAGQAGSTADHQAAASAQAQCAGALAVVAGDADDAGQGQAGASVQYRVTADGDGVVQQQVAAGEDQVGRQADGALVGQADTRQGTDGGAAAATDAQRPGAPARYVAGDGAAVDQRADRTAAQIEGADITLDQPAVGQHTDGATIGDRDGAGSRSRT